jgi:hypothetical protein
MSKVPLYYNFEHEPQAAWAKLLPEDLAALRETIGQEIRKALKNTIINLDTRDFERIRDIVAEELEAYLDDDDDCDDDDDDDCNEGEDDEDEDEDTSATAILSKAINWMTSFFQEDGGKQVVKTHIAVPGKDALILKDTGSLFDCEFEYDGRHFIGAAFEMSIAEQERSPQAVKAITARLKAMIAQLQQEWDWDATTEKAKANAEDEAANAEDPKEQRLAISRISLLALRQLGIDLDVDAFTPNRQIADTGLFATIHDKLLLPDSISIEAILLNNWRECTLLLRSSLFPVLPDDAIEPPEVRFVYENREGYTWLTVYLGNTAIVSSCRVGM